MRTWLALFVGLAIAGFGFSGAHAGTLNLPSGTIYGVWDFGTTGAPVSLTSLDNHCGRACTSLNGLLGNDPVVGQSAPKDNGTTAVTQPNPTVDLTRVPKGQTQSNGSVLTWGTDNPSTLTFRGNWVDASNSIDPGCPAIPGACPRLGLLTFFNGASPIDSLIFGALLNLSLLPDDGSPSRSLGSVEIVINTSINIGTPDQNKDYVNICGENSRICNASNPKSLPAIESQPAASPGYVIGDPELVVVDLIAVPGHEVVIGSDLPLALLVPEPASWTILIVGLGFIIALHLVGSAPSRS